MAEQTRGGRHDQPAAEGAPRRDWWRRGHVPFMLAAAVMAPLVYGLPVWMERNDDAIWGRTPPAAAAASAEDTASLAGTDWEFLGALAGDPEHGVVAVDAIFAVTPGSKVDTQRLHTNCDVRALDDRGRIWEDGAAYGEIPDFADATGQTGGGGCASPPPGMDPFPVGEESLLMVHFGVPRDAVRDLRFEVEVATHDPADTPDFSDEDLMDTDVEDDNPPEPVAASFGFGELERDELIRRGFIRG